MSEGCEIFAEVIITTAKGLPPGAGIMALSRANAAMCFYAPQTCAALPVALAAGGAIDAWAEFVQYSPAFEELNKVAFSKGCRLVISPIDEGRRTWRAMLVTVEDASKTAREVAEVTSRQIANSQDRGVRLLEVLQTPSGLSWLMKRLSGM